LRDVVFDEGGAAKCYKHIILEHDADSENLEAGHMSDPEPLKWSQDKKSEAKPDDESESESKIEGLLTAFVLLAPTSSST
jgi:hypothetical protein